MEEQSLENQSFFEKLKKNWFVSAVITIVAGALLVLFPSITLKVAGYVIGAIAIVMGIVRTVRYFKDDHTYPVILQSDLMVGLLAVGFGLFIFASPDKVMAMVPYVFGILLIGCGIGNALRSLDAKKAGMGSWIVLLVLALVSVAAGVLCIIDPFTEMETTVIVIGAALLYQGVTDIVTTLIVRKKLEAAKGTDKPAEKA